MHLHPNRSSDIIHDSFRLLLLLSQEGIEKFSLPDILAKFAMFEENVHCLPKRVTQDLDHLLMHESVLTQWLKRIPALGSRQREGHGATPVCGLQSRTDLTVTIGRAEAHHHVIGA